MNTRQIPAGLLGNYYAVRHSHGHYRSCGVTGSYIFSREFLERSPYRLLGLLRYTLHHTIQRHPSLCYGVVEEKNNVDAHFYQLETIEFDDIVEIRSSKLPKEQQDRAMEKEIGMAHDHLFQEQDRKPGWKIVVLEHDSEVSDNDTRVDVIYINQHAIGDGTSAAAFHKTFIRFLHQAMGESDLQVSWPYEVPAELPELQLIEQVCPFPPEFDSSLASKIVTSDDPSFDAWTAALPTMDGFASRARILTISSFDVSRILSYCRQLKITLTGLLHSLFVIYLAKTVQDARGFRAVTPYSMRRFSGAPDDEILNHISYITIDWKESVASFARSAEENSKEEEEVILKIAKQYQREITEELCNVPQRGSTALIEVWKIKDLNKFCDDGLKEKRGCTYEISNIGAVTLPEMPVGSEGVQLEKLTFTQCGMVAGPALGCSVISIKGKSLVVSLHWQEGILEESFVEQMISYLERRLLSLGQAIVV